jgi:hypothetical protein
MKTILKFKMTVLFALLVASFSYAQNENSIDWTTDLEVYKSQLESKHIDLYHSINKQTFDKELSRIKVLSDSATDFKVILELMKLTRRIGDGHTAVSLRHLNTHTFPFEVKFIENKWRVVKISHEHKNLLKSSLVAINGVPIDEVAAKVSEVAQFVENKHSQVIRTGSYLTISELLYALEIIDKENTAFFTFQDENKQEVKISLNTLDKNEASNLENFIELVIGVPQISKPEEPMFDYLWYAPIEQYDAVYIQFNSYPSFEDIQVFGEELVGYITENEIKQVVIDMRNNGGGDLYVGVVLAYALNLADTIDWKQGVYVMTDAVTFSAATSNSVLFKQLLNAKIVGQPTGSNPTGYQDMDQFELPNSKLVITYSKRRFELSETVTQGIQPDELLNYSWSDFSQGNDNMLQWVIKDIKQ